MMLRFWAVVVLSTFLVAAGARSDDWPQFRRDANHSAASKDTVRLPLTEIWTQSPSGKTSPIYDAAIWRNHVYYVAGEGGVKPIRALICADAATGSTVWRQVLASPKLGARFSNSIGPSVSDDGGVVYVYDQLPVYELSGTHESGGGRVQSPDIDGMFMQLAAFGRRYLGLEDQAPSFASAPPGLEIKKTASGKVIFRGLVVLPEADPSPRGDKKSSRVARHWVDVDFEPRLTYALRAFSAVSGQPGPVLPLRKSFAYESLYHEVLSHSPQQDLVRAVVNVAAPKQGGSLDGPGHPLLSRSVVTATLNDLLLKWDLGPAGGSPLTRWRIRHVLAGVPVDITPSASFAGYPPVAAASGYFLGEDNTHRFLGVVGTAPLQSSWHSDLQNTYGIPALAQELVYLGVGGSGACNSIVAMNPLTGATAWNYAPLRVGPDPVRMQRAFGIDTWGYEVGWADPADPTVMHKVRGAGADSWTLNLPHSTLLPGHWNNSGLVVTSDAVFGEVREGEQNGTIVALDRATGLPRWRLQLPTNAQVRSIAASSEHLFISYTITRGAREPVWGQTTQDPSTLLAVRITDGKEAWKQPVPHAGNLMVASGMLFLADGELHAFAPAERTFQLAVDSDRAEDYRAPSAPAPAQPQGEPAAEAAPEPVPAADEKALAEMTVVRCRWNEPVADVLARLETRRKLAPASAMLVSLDGLDAKRETWIPPGSEAAFSDEWTAAYIETSKRLAQTKPAYLEILPEINVYLTRHPERIDDVKELIEATVRQIRAVSPQTRVVVSFNAEVLSGRYGTVYQPFDKLPVQGVSATALREMAAAADAFGLTSCPQAAFAVPQQMPSTYLLALRSLLGGKSVLVTQLRVRADGAAPTAVTTQGAFVAAFLQGCYWLDAAVVAYPDISAENGMSTGSESALRVGEESRPGLRIWQGILAHRRVGRLSLKGDDGDAMTPAEKQTAP